MYATEYSGIPQALAQNAALKKRFVSLLFTAQIPGKASQGGGRAAVLKRLLTEITDGTRTLTNAYGRCEIDLPERGSMYAGDAKVFPSGWGERLIRTQVSRFYNQAVLELQLESGATLVHVGHSSAEQATSRCSQELAGRDHDAQTLLDRLRDRYDRGNFGGDAKPTVPEHPNCTHTVMPVA